MRGGGSVQAVVTRLMAEETEQHVTPQKKKLTFNLDPVPSYDVKGTKEKIESLLTPKTILLWLIAAGLAIRLTVLAVEFSHMFGMRTPDQINYPTYRPEEWVTYRSDYLRQLLIMMGRQSFEAILFFAIIYEDWLLHGWNRFCAYCEPKLGKGTGKFKNFLRMTLFFEVIVILWLVKEYMAGAVTSVVQMGIERAPYVWPHQMYSPLALRLLVTHVLVIGSLAAWEWLGDFRYFGLVAGLSYFALHCLVIILEPTKLGLWLRYNGELEPVDPDSHIHDLISDVSKLTDNYPLSNFYIRPLTSSRMSACGFRSHSAVIVDEGLWQFFVRCSGGLVYAFPETAGPDDPDLIFQAVALHELGHILTSQAVWYNMFGYGLVLAVLVWFIFAVAMQRPITFRSFGFKHKPIPPICVLLILTIAFLSLWSCMLAPLSNLLSWLKEAEADEMAAALGFGPALHKYLYTLQAGGSRFSRSMGLLASLFYCTHPPFYLRVRWINAYQ